MKKKLTKKLMFSKSTIAHLDPLEQNKIKGGDTCEATCATEVCGTCVTICTCATMCDPHACDSIPLRECESVHCQ